MLIVPRPQFNHDRYIHPVYSGAGIGSIFGRLLARVAGRAARTGLKSAIKVGSKVAKKSLNKVTRKTISRVAKKGIHTSLKGTLKKGLHAGKSFAKRQIKTLPKKVINYAIKKSKDPKTQQSIQKVITKGTKEVLKSLVPSNTTNIHTPANNSTNSLKKAAVDTINTFLPPVNSSPRPFINSGVKRKRPFTKHQKKSTLVKRQRKANSFAPDYSTTDLNSLIART